MTKRTREPSTGEDCLDTAYGGTGTQIVSEEDCKSRIAGNPSVKTMSALMPLAKAVNAITGAMKGLGLRNEAVDRIHQSMTDVLRQSDMLDSMPATRPRYPRSSAS